MEDPLEKLREHGKSSPPPKEKRKRRSSRYVAMKVISKEEERDGVKIPETLQPVAFESSIKKCRKTISSDNVVGIIKLYCYRGAYIREVQQEIRETSVP